MQLCLHLIVRLHELRGEPYLQTAHTATGGTGVQLFLVVEREAKMLLQPDVAADGIGDGFRNLPVLDVERAFRANIRPLLGNVSLNQFAAVACPLQQNFSAIRVGHCALEDVHVKTLPDYE